MKQSCILAVFFLAFFQLGPLFSSSQLISDQNTAMAAISALLRSSRWNTTNPNPCSWKGVTCDSNSPARITALSLSGLGIDPTTTTALFSHICYLESLKSLDLSRNLVTSIPSNLSSPCLGLEGLKALNLSTNKLSGHLLPLAGLRNLTSLDVSSNLLEGPIDSQLEELDHLRSLNLSFNLFYGAIPVRVGRSASLQELQLSHNRFNGSIPLRLMDHRNLTLLDLSWNNIAGSLPDSIGNLSKLQTLLLSSNSMTGELPPALSSMASLSWLGANQNKFSGSIPSGVAKTDLHMLDLSYNMLSGSIPLDLLSSTNLVAADLSYNSLTGPIPLNMSRTLYRLRLSGNELNGSIPSTIGRLEALTYLELDDNRLGGEIPHELWSCKNLALLNLAMNSLQGTLPRELSNLQELEVLKLQVNNITGVIPDEVSGLQRLLSLNLSRNLITGQMPSSISTLKKLSNLNLESNRLTGLIPAGIINLESLIELQLGDNMLASPIPRLPERLATALNLSSNGFQGEIPVFLGKLNDLEVLDLSNNRFTGQVPSVLSQMKSLTHLFLSNNQLSGVLPSFPPWVDVQIRGNRGLENSTRGPVPAYNTTSKKKIPVLVIAVVSIVSAFIGSGLAVAILCFMSRRIHRVKSEVPASEDGHPQVISSRILAGNGIHMSRVDFSKAMEAVCDPTNILHRTRFSTYYKALMPCGESYSVKKLDWGNKALQAGSHARIRKELEILAKLSNSNVMIPLAYALTADSTYLFYENTHKGTVWDALHRHDGDVLSWSARYSIALGVAQGLAFLHGNKQPVLLFDLSTRSVLLKSLEEPQIGDIELWRIVDPTKSAGSAGSISAIAGSVGYVPPEYAYTMRVTMAGNVYSFGVILLELLTGRQPVSEGIEIAKWASNISNQLGELDQILDPRISNTSEAIHKQMMAVMNVALDCVSSAPGKRPKMRNALNLLLHAR